MSHGAAATTPSSWSPSAAPRAATTSCPSSRTWSAGANVPTERLREVAAHYEHFGGVSPINAQCRALDRRAARGARPPRAAAAGLLGQPQLAPDARRHAAARWREDGVRRALAFVTSAYGSYSGCRQYLDDIARARAEVGERAPRGRQAAASSTTTPASSSRSSSTWPAPSSGSPSPGAPRPGWSSPPTACPARWPPPATTRPQLRETAAPRGVPARPAGVEPRLPEPQRAAEPAVARARHRRPPARARRRRGAGRGGGADRLHRRTTWRCVYDLDLEAKSRALELGLNMVRAATVGTHPRFVRDDPRARRGAAVRRARAPAPRHARARPGRVPAGLLPVRPERARS